MCCILSNRLMSTPAVKAANRAEALRLAAELKQIKMERQFLNADADKMEEEKFRGLATGIVRSTKEKQVRDRDADRN